jgi:FixJ family two-component response regulator
MMWTVDLPRPKSDPAPRVFVVDDDVSVREAMSSLIRSAGIQVESFASAQAFRERRRDDAPGCVVLDVRLPGSCGLEIQRELAGLDADLPVIFITGHADVPTTVRAMKAGAIEFLLKPLADADILEAVERAIAQHRAARELRAELAVVEASYQSLTPREREVMERVTAGLLNKQIAAELGTREVTVKVHRAQVMRKMGADSLAGLVRQAEKLGLPRDKGR